jgi:hypothetical protein
MDVVYRPLGVTEEREWGGTGQFGGWESYITPVGGGSIEGSQRDDGGRLHHTRGVRWHTAQARYIRGVHGHSRTPCRALAQPQTRFTGSCSHERAPRSARWSSGRGYNYTFVWCAVGTGATDMDEPNAIPIRVDKWCAVACGWAVGGERGV